MKNRIETEIKCNHFVGKKWKRVIAVALSALMVSSVVDYSGLINVNAQTQSDNKTITAFAELSEDVRNQEIAEGTSEADINLPEGYSISEGLSLPQINVEILETENSNWTFQESQTIDGIKITVKADEGVFPAGAVLNVKKIVNVKEQEKIEEAIIEEVKAEETDKTVTKLISYDITVTDAQGNELQPDTSKGEVKVNFAQLPMAAESIASSQELKVFHMDETLSEAQGLDTTVDEAVEAVEITAEHFSVYTVAQLTDEIRANVEAEIKALDGTLTYYDTIEEAITAAQTMEGCIVKLLKDVETDSSVNITSGVLTIDLYGKTWSFSGDSRVIIKGTANVTVMNSGSGGKITSTGSFTVVREEEATLRLEGGTYQGGTTASIQNLTGDVGSLLADGYVYIQEGGTAVTDTSGNMISNVTVQPVPAQITVQITAQPQDAANTTYGYSSAPAMSVSAETIPSVPPDSVISYQWYRVKSGDETSDTIVGTNASTLTIPTGLDAGAHSFYCAVSCDGYIVNSESASFTVEKATPAITLDFIVYENDPLVYGNLMYFTARVTGANGDCHPDGTVTLMDGNNILYSNMDFFNIGKFYQRGSNSIFAATHSFTAIYNPSTGGTGKNYVSVTSAAVEKTIAKAEQDTLSTTEITGKKYGDPDFTLDVRGGDGIGMVTYLVPEGNGVLSISGSTATIIGAGTVTITVTKDADRNYNEATGTRSITVDKADTAIAFEPSYNGTFTYNGTSVPNPTEADLTITGASYSDVTFAWQDSHNKALDNPPTAPGNYYLCANIGNTNNHKESSKIIEVTIRYYSAVIPVLYNINPVIAPWYNTDVSISAVGFTVSDTIDGTYTSSYLISEEGTVNKTLYFKQDGTGYITDGQSIAVNIDKTAPAFSGATHGITISDNHWKEFLNAITFEHFYKETKNVTIEATDSVSGIYQYYYYIDTTGSTTVKSAEELSALTFTEGNSFSITDENNYIIYSYVLDLAGNRSAYVSTDGIVIDKTAPAVTLTAPAGSDLGDVSATAKVQMNETGISTYVIRPIEESGITAQEILDSPEKNTASVKDGNTGIELDMELSGLAANTTYYLYAVGTDSAGNNSTVQSTSFTTTKTQPTFASTLTITGTYGQQVKDMTVFQAESTNGIAGIWSASSTDIPSVGTLTSYDVFFTPDDTESNATVTVPVTPTITPKSLAGVGVTIGEVMGTYTYDGTAKESTVTVTDSVVAIKTLDYDYSYSNNTSVGTAILTITGKGNYTGIINRTFTIVKAAAPVINYPTAGSIIYGQKLSASTLNAGSTEYGTFAWTNGNTVPTVTNSGCEVTFTPSANTVANYETITNTTEAVAVSLSKVTPAVSVSAEISDDAGSRKATLTATITGAGNGETPTGTVKFVNSTSGSDVNLAGATEVTITGGIATYTWTGLASQIYKVKAVYSGSGNYNTATSAELGFDTSKQNQAALSIGNIATKTYGDEVFNLSTTGGSGDEAVTFTSSNSDIVSISGATATIHKAGTITITATKAATDIYNEASASVSLTVAKKVLNVKAESKLNIIKGTTMPVLTFTVTGLVGNDTFTNPVISATATDTSTIGEYNILISGGTLANDDLYTVNYMGGKLTVINEPVSPGSPSSGGGSSSDTTQPDAGMPVIKGASNKAGWDAINEQIKQTQKGDTITVKMNGSLVVPRDVLGTIRGTNVNLVFEMSDGITWSVNGQSITDSTLEDINFGVTMDTDVILENLIHGIAGKQAYRSISLSHDGNFGFTAVLSINMQKKNEGHYANLFYYNPTSGKLKLQSIEKVNEDGYVEYMFTHASDYVIVLSTEPMYAKALDQITISAIKETLYVGGTKNKSMNLNLELPELLKEIAQKDSSQLVITYKSSNPKVATVTTSGKIIAKKTGKTTITTLVQIGGAKKSFKTIIKVSKVK